MFEQWVATLIVIDFESADMLIVIFIYINTEHTMNMHLITNVT